MENEHQPKVDTHNFDFGRGERDLIKTLKDNITFERVVRVEIAKAATHQNDCEYRVSKKTSGGAP